MFVLYEEMDNGCKQVISLPTDEDQINFLLDLFSRLEPNKTYGILKEVE